MENVVGAKNSALVTRLKKEMSKNNINARKLAEKAGLGQSFVYDILNGKSSNPTSKNIEAIAKALGTSVSYLLSGRQVFEDIFSDSPLASPSNAGKLIAIPTISLEFTEGGEVFVEERPSGRPHFFHLSWIEKQLKAEVDNLRIVFNSGDSMHPTLGDGDMALIDVSKKSPSSAGIFALFDGIGLVIKRLESTGAQKIKIISDNPKYSPFEKPKDDISIIGKVIWFSRNLV